MAYLKNPIILIAVGNRLRDVRKKKGLTQEDVAHKAGVAVSQVGRIERGKLNPSISTMFVIALAMDIEPKELFDFEEPFVKKKPEGKKKK
ncbi:MAG: helix-turn-helix domain-containing protein [Bacteroidota bacterium]